MGTAYEETYTKPTARCCERQGGNRCQLPRRFCTCEQDGESVVVKYEPREVAGCCSDDSLCVRAVMQPCVDPLP